MPLEEHIFEISIFKVDNKENRFLNFAKWEYFLNGSTVSRISSITRRPSRTVLHILLGNLFYIRGLGRFYRIRRASTRDKQNGKMARVSCSRERETNSDLAPDAYVNRLQSNFFRYPPANLRKRGTTVSPSLPVPLPLPLPALNVLHVYAHIYARAPSSRRDYDARTKTNFE